MRDAESELPEPQDQFSSTESEYGPAPKESSFMISIPVSAIYQFLRKIFQRKPQQ